jgi:nitrite reductase/ring-hydroxylating ferredoxin subunit/uncharacterized membrane protein
MRSTAQFRSHPIHAMLIPFPIGLLVGAFIADLGGALLDNPHLWLVAWYLAIGGVAMGLVAAVPGFIDYVRTVPPKSSAKTRATKHMLVNVGAVAIFAFAWWIRGAPEVAPGLAILLMEGVGVLLLTMGGWMGGTLVYRNQIGVDHRYAEAGKWKEIDVGDRKNGSIPVADADELEIDQMKLVRVGERRIVLARTEDGHVAFDDRCSHKGGSLAGGMMICGTVQCPWHGSQFDVHTGGVEAGPAEGAITTYRVEQKDGKLHLIV